MVANSPPTQPYSLNPSFAGVHPNLVAELHGLDGRLNAQIQHAYYVNRDTFAGSLLENQGQLGHKARPWMQQQPVQQSQPQPVPPPQPPTQVQPQVQPQPPAQTAQPAAYSLHQLSDPSNAASPPSSCQTLSQIPDGLYYTPEAVSDTDIHGQGLAYPQQTWQDPMPTHNQYIPESQPSVQSWLNHPQDYMHMQLETQQRLQAQQSPSQGNYVAPVYAYPMTAPPQTYSHAQYTPEAAMRTHTVDDHSLQEHWTSFMYNVGSPRQFMD